MAMLMSFLAQGLSSIPGDYFCYIAISSAAIVGILPGYLVRVCAPLIRGVLLIMLHSDKFSGIGVEEHRLREHQNGLFTDLHHVLGIWSPNRL